MLAKWENGDYQRNFQKNRVEKLIFRLEFSTVDSSPLESVYHAQVHIFHAIEPNATQILSLAISNLLTHALAE